jgi:hypothetical protein
MSLTARESHAVLPLFPDGRPSLTDRLADYFRARPGQWINGLHLSFAGSYAWRSRVSELRRAPYFLTIRNRQTRVRAGDHTVTVSEYAWIPDRNTEAGAADSVRAPSAAV